MAQIEHTQKPENFQIAEFGAQGVFVSVCFRPKADTQRIKNNLAQWGVAG